ncbi:hypothetical protein JHK85_006791 [Glycine max]|nr:hypothetical protein JHK85_006791 [Glycine max]
MSSEEIEVYQIFLNELELTSKEESDNSSEDMSYIMAHSPDKIKSIDGSKETLKLSVRINDLWFIGTPNKSEQAEMVFVDSNCVLRDIPFRKYRFAGFADVVAGQFEPGLLLMLLVLWRRLSFTKFQEKVEG